MPSLYRTRLKKKDDIRDSRILMISSGRFDPELVAGSRSNATL